MCNFLLADEINRASPKAQSSLLEVMEEYQISLDGNTYQLPQPFMTLATQNPIETYGTYHLPEAQMDRFLYVYLFGYPSKEQEMEILNRLEHSTPIKTVSSVMTTDDIMTLRGQAEKVFVSDKIKDYILDISNVTRNSPYFRLGASPRASIALMKASKAYAFVDGRDYVTPDDVKRMCIPVYAHRLILSPKGKSEFENAEPALDKIMSQVEVPVK